jgi:superfamily II DNA helicase RecQ
LSGSIIRTLYVHEQSVCHDNASTTTQERRAIVVTFESFMMELASFAYIHRHDNKALCEKFHPFLNNPSDTCYYCQECQVIVANRNNHFGGRHYSKCIDRCTGRTIMHWERNDPGVVPEPVPFDDLSIFCPTFRRHYYQKMLSQSDHRVSNSPNVDDDHFDASTINQTEELVVSDDSPAQLALDEIFAAQTERFRVNPADRIVQIHNHRAEPNLWLLRTGYDIHLNGLNMMELYLLSSKSLSDDENHIGRIWSRVETMSKLAVEYATSIDRSNLVLMEVKRIDARPTHKPFNTTLKKGTWEKYLQVLQKVVTVIFRLESGDDRRKRYRLTEEQKELFQTASNDHSNQQTDGFYLKLLFSLLRQRIIDESYECVLLSALAAMSIKRDATYLPPNDVTTLYAALIAVFRALILFAARKYPVDRGGLLTNTAILTDEMMIHPDSSRRPGAMAWIWHTFSYAKVISQNTMKPALCYWDNDVLVYRGTTNFSMLDFRLMLKHYITEAKSHIAKLLLLPDDHTGLDIPTIHWGKMVDDLHDTRPGYSFLSDSRNEWITEKENFVFHKIRSDPTLAEEWVDTNTKEINQAKLDEYGQVLEKLRRILFGLIHLTAGQPARGTEITNLRFENTLTPRNIIIDRRLVAIRTSYHKMMLQTSEAKHIYRYLPPCVGELLVHYLWLILPFWQFMKGSSMESREKSLYLWSKDLVFPLNKTVDPNDLWDTTKLSRVLNDMTKTCMGIEVNVSSWRHIAIAISRRFLKRGFTDPTDDDDDNDDENEDVGTFEEVVNGRRGNNIPTINVNSVYDLQASHSVRVANSTYGRLITGPNETPKNMVDAYHLVSIEWHRLLFPELIHLLPNRNDDPNDSYRSFMQQLRMRRLGELANMDLTYRLREFLHRFDAEFRGNQKEVLEAVVRGDSVVLQVSATGSGKSYSFMIPAFCSPDGTTIVIVPLVALQKDLERRCAIHCITAKVWSESISYVTPMLLFVTPESAVTKAFMDYVSLLTYSHKLDRIVFDECHSVLLGNDEFRPKFADLKHTLQRTGVQVLLLTATLPPTLEADLIRFLGMEYRHISRFRVPTTRRNIAYVVKTGTRQQDSWVNLIQSEMMSDNQKGKCIIYCRRLEDGEFLALSLSLPFYHSQCGTRRLKETMIETFANTGSAIVATNALGLGLDIPDISLVIHIGAPRFLLDFVQESGRAGRDGRSSKSVLLTLPYDDVADDMREYITCCLCRRSVLDFQMDGTKRTHGCQRNDNPCDRCCIHNKFTQNSSTNPIAVTQEPPNDHYNINPEYQIDDDVAFDTMDDDMFLQICDQAIDTQKSVQKASTKLLPKTKHPLETPNAYCQPVAKRIVVTHDRIEARMDSESRRRQHYNQQNRECHTEVASAKQMLADIQQTVHKKGRCLQCYLHKMPSCATDRALDHSRLNKEIAKEALCMAKELRRIGFPRFTACYSRDFFLPQDICQSWELNNNGGYIPSKRPCQYPNILLPTILSIIKADPSMNDILSDIMKKQSAVSLQALFLKEVMGKWNGVQTTYLFVAFFELTKPFKYKHKIN